MTFDLFWTYFRLYLAVLDHTVNGCSIKEKQREYLPETVQSVKGYTMTHALAFSAGLLVNTWPQCRYCSLFLQKAPDIGHRLKLIFRKCYTTPFNCPPARPPPRPRVTTCGPGQPFHSAVIPCPPILPTPYVTWWPSAFSICFILPHTKILWCLQCDVYNKVIQSKLPQLTPGNYWENPASLSVRKYGKLTESAQLK